MKPANTSIERKI